MALGDARQLQRSEGVKLVLAVDGEAAFDEARLVCL